MNFIHRWLNPHCPDCRSEHECKTCDTLKDLLEAERRTNKELLDSLLGKTELIKIEEKEPIKITNRDIPWRVRQQMLEAEDAQKAKIMKDLEQLEKDTGIKDANKISEAV